MRILILTDASDRHFYFCNRIASEADHVVGIITGGKEINRPWTEQVKRTLTRHPLQSARQFYFKKRYRSYGRAIRVEKREAEKRFFADGARQFTETFSELVIGPLQPSDRSINDRRFVELIRSSEPDAIVVMGTCILGSAILKSAPVILNMHTGLSPYYRGGRTNFWPFIENDPGYFGVTVHKMSSGIDTGDIVYSERIKVETGDTFGSINAKSIVAGTGLMIKALKHLRAGTMNALPQWTPGKLFHDRDWTLKAAKIYFDNREALIERQIQGETEDAFSAIVTVENGRAKNG
ncbi:hypothetical protein E1180_20695 [Roseibium denhamense]|uniref:phosphoribosylglycinamide formyltransferase 1 n=1 Tax=Roseibium denhamense TaxID=76305 RepID=A0ABY1NPM2_9HYPH|nr:formyl transferase [Roseibium denhamense]MTI07924.1 hypothetical protein [Roseibium denhamense]SMP14951.1 Formyl transferase [Roseibium denhamense]